MKSSSMLLISKKRNEKNSIFKKTKKEKKEKMKQLIKKIEKEKNSREIA